MRYQVTVTYNDEAAAKRNKRQVYSTMILSGMGSMSKDLPTESVFVFMTETDAWGVYDYFQYCRELSTFIVAKPESIPGSGDDDEKTLQEYMEERHMLSEPSAYDTPLDWQHEN